MFNPQIFDIAKQGYSFNFLKKDLLSGLTVAIVAIPLSIAFAIASGAMPIIGIFTAIIGGLIVSLLGGSKYNISGPAGAFIGIIYATIAHYGYRGLLVSTFLAGIFIMCFSILKFGKFMKYIPNCVIVGFSIGLGFDILSGQIADFLGLMAHGGENFIKKITICWQNLSQTKTHSVLLGTITIISTIIVRKIKPSLPAFLLAIIVSCLVAKLFGLQAETIESKFGLIHLEIPNFHEDIVEEIEQTDNFFHYIIPSLTIAFLASIEALLAATIADKMTGNKHRPNTELFALGIANCVSGLFGCIPIAGTTARTIVNVRSGAKSSMAGVFHGLFLIILIAIFASLISNINMPTIAGILFVVSVDMMAWKKVVNLCKTDNMFNIIMMFFTAICVLLFGIVVAIIANTIVYQILMKTVVILKKPHSTRLN